MKNHWTVYVITAFVLQSAASMPVLADEARHEQREANREARRAADARTDAAVDRMEGHPIRAELDAKHARHEERRAVRHARDAAYDRGW